MTTVRGPDGAEAAGFAIVTRGRIRSSWIRRTLNTLMATTTSAATKMRRMLPVPIIPAGIMWQEGKERANAKASGGASLTHGEDQENASVKIVSISSLIRRG